MRHEIAFPMYDVHRPDSEALLASLRELLVARGYDAHALVTVWPHSDLSDHWRSDRLLLSQTCGFPLVTQLPDVQTVGCFHYSAPGCEDTRYRSVLVARKAGKPPALAHFRNRVAVCNAADSQSGYRALLNRVSPLAHHGAFFSHVRFSGSHRQSLIEVGRGRADIAAIDCVTYALLQRHQPALLEGLAVIDHTPLTPGVPLITAQQTSPETLFLLRDALRELVSHPDYQEICAALFITGFSDMAREAYAPLLTEQHSE